MSGVASFPGDVIIGDQSTDNLVILGTLQGGLPFPAVQAPSTNPNVLDDYKEGTFTPVLVFGGASTGITYSAQQGAFVKVGKLVTIYISIALTSKGTATGLAQITGCPYGDSLGFSPVISGFFSNFVTLTGPVTGRMGTAATITLGMPGAASMGNLTDANFAANSSMNMVGSFIAAN